MKKASAAITNKLAAPTLLAFALLAGTTSICAAVDGTGAGASVDLSNSSSSQPALRTNATGLAPQTVAVQKILKSRTAAIQLAHEVWLDKTVAMAPELVAAICAHPYAATVLAAHPHIDAIADADHLLCRRLTRWHSATEVLLRNPQADHVISLDPEGMYWAIERRPAYARVLAGHTQFYKMVDANPDLGRVVAQHMW